MKASIAVLAGVCLLSGCAFHKPTTISSNPTGASITIAGEKIGLTPLNTVLPCKTFGHKRRAIIISQEGYRAVNTELDYKVSGRNVTWNILFLPYTLPGFFMNLKCPRPNYYFDLQKESAGLQGEATLTVAELIADSEVYVGQRLIVPGEPMVLAPGRQELSVKKGEVLVSIGEIRLDPDTDYLVRLEARHLQ